MGQVSAKDIKTDSPVSQQVRCQWKTDWQSCLIVGQMSAKDKNWQSCLTAGQVSAKDRLAVLSHSRSGVSERQKLTVLSNSRSGVNERQIDSPVSLLVRCQQRTHINHPVSLQVRCRWRTHRKLMMFPGDILSCPAEDLRSTKSWTPYSVYHVAKNASLMRRKVSTTWSPITHSAL